MLQSSLYVVTVAVPTALELVAGLFPSEISMAYAGKHVHLICVRSTNKGGGNSDVFTPSSDVSKNF